MSTTLYNICSRLRSTFKPLAYGLAGIIAFESIPLILSSPQQSSQSSQVSTESSSSTSRAVTYLTGRDQMRARAKIVSTKAFLRDELANQKPNRELPLFRDETPDNLVARLQEVVEGKHTRIGYYMIRNYNENEQKYLLLTARTKSGSDYHIPIAVSHCYLESILSDSASHSAAKPSVRSKPRHKVQRHKYSPSAKKDPSKNQSQVVASKPVEEPACPPAEPVSTEPESRPLNADSYRHGTILYQGRLVSLEEYRLLRGQEIRSRPPVSGSYQPSPKAPQSENQQSQNCPTCHYHPCTCDGMAKARKRDGGSNVIGWIVGAGVAYLIIKKLSHRGRGPSASPSPTPQPQPPVTPTYQGSNGPFHPEVFRNPGDLRR